jgi:IMP dehydrogenase
MEEWLTYDQISLIPTQVSTLEHRADADTGVEFGGIRLKVPIIAAPMPDVTNGEMARKLAALGSFGWVHRFQTPDEQQAQIYPEEYAPYKDLPRTLGIAIPAKLPEADLIVGRFYHGFGVRIFCLDTANGASETVRKTIERLKTLYPEIFLVVGNVASAENFRKLEQWGADAIRVGIAGGSVCETRTETGIYSPMASVIVECATRGHKRLRGPKEPEPNHALLIADGGIRTPADMCKALALGADLVMMGGALAGTREAPGSVIKTDGKKYKLLRGAASFSVQQGQSDYNEGAETLVPYQGSVEKVISRFAAGLRSSMSYNNARTLDEFRKNVKVVRI